MKKACFIFSLYLSASTLSYTAFSQHNSDVQTNLTKATYFLNAAKYDSAIIACTSVLHSILVSKNKKYEAQAYNILAEIMMRNGRKDEQKKYDALLEPLAYQQKDTSLIIAFKNRLGLSLLEDGNTKEAANHFVEVLSLGLEKSQSLKTAEVFSNLATVFMALGKRDQAMLWFFKALRLYEKLGSDVGQGETYSNISSLYYLMGNVSEAISFQKKSIFFRERSNDIAGLVIPNINIGQLYILKDSANLALAHIKQAVVYAEKINNEKLMGSAYSGMSTYYIKKNDYNLALIWQNKAITLFEKSDNKTMLSRLYVSAGNLANATNDSLGAISFYSKALAISSQLKNYENISNVYEKMSNFFLSHNDFFNAYQYFKIFTSYKDTIAAGSNMANIEKIRIEFETEKKENEIQRLNSEQKIKTLQIEKQNALIAGNLLEAQKKQKEIELLSNAGELQELKISQQDEQLEKQKLLAKTSKQQLQLADAEKKLQQRQLKNSETTRKFILGGAALLLLLAVALFNRYQLKRKIKEQEVLLAVRNNIAKDLHDEIGSTLTSIKILSEVSGKNLNKDQEKVSSYITKITEQSAAAQQGISDIVWAIKPENDKLENMVVRMREYASQTLESRNILTQVNVNESLLQQTLDMKQRRDFLLVYREAINNIAKYAEATLVNITLRKNADNIQLVISDNGIGFDTGKTTSSSGLKNMHSRAEALGGNLTLLSSPDNGTTITLNLPTT